MNETNTLPANVLELNDIHPFFDEKTLPELIQGQVGKLNELDRSVKAALVAAELAEKRAKAASERSAGRAWFQDKKREAIEELQTAGIELASAVQSSAQAQKISFEFQRRLADISKYLFTLGVSNIAANRTVVRELEKRLSGASEEELSELARQEVLAVIQQLKEQEDILRKQTQMARILKEHDGKVAHLLSHTDDLGIKLATIETCQEARHEAQGKTAETLKQELATQKQAMAVLQHQFEALQARLETMELSLAQAEQRYVSLRQILNFRGIALCILSVALSVIIYFVFSDSLHW